jgi:hypothetical protein
LFKCSHELLRACYDLAETLYVSVRGGCRRQTPGWEGGRALRGKGWEKRISETSKDDTARRQEKPKTKAEKTSTGPKQRDPYKNTLKKNTTPTTQDGHKTNTKKW